MFNFLSSKNMILFLLLLMTPLGQISVDFYSISLPAMSKYFHINDNTIKITTISYLFAFAVGQVFHGFLSDKFGRRYMLVISFPFYIFSTIFTPLVSSIYAVILLRFIQGLTIAAASVNVKAIAVDIYDEKGLAKIMSQIATVWGLSPVFTSLFGSCIQTLYGWQGCFYTLGIISSVIYIFLIYYLPETKFFNTRINIKNSFYNGLSILKSGDFWFFTLQVSLSVSVLLTYVTQTPFIFQGYYQLTSFQNGLLILILCGFYFFGNLIAQKTYISVMSLTSKPIRAIITIFWISLIYLAIENVYNLSFYPFFMYLNIVMFSVGLIFPINLSKCLHLFPKNSGMVSGLNGFISLMFSTLALIFINLLEVNNNLVFSFAIFMQSSFILLILTLLQILFGKNLINRVKICLLI